MWTMTPLCSAVPVALISRAKVVRMLIAAL
jgi:hypothetical protein